LVSSFFDDQDAGLFLPFFFQSLSLPVSFVRDTPIPPFLLISFLLFSPPLLFSTMAGRGIPPPSGQSDYDDDDDMKTDQEIEASGEEASGEEEAVTRPSTKRQKTTKAPAAAAAAASTKSKRAKVSEPSVAAAEAAADASKKKRNRRTKVQMLADRTSEEGDKTQTVCDQCGVGYVATGHNCSLKTLLNPPIKTSNGMETYEYVKVTCEKQFFGGSAWKQPYREFMVQALRRCVATQHKAVHEGCRTMAGFMLETLKPITISNVHTYIGPQVTNDKLILKIYQNAVKNAFVLHLFNCDKHKRAHPINNYYKSQFLPHKVTDEHGVTTLHPGFPNLHAYRSSDKQTHLNKTTLQDAARRITTSWRVNIYRNQAARNKYWARLEWKRIVARTPILSSHKKHSSRAKVVEKWLFDVLLNENHLQELAELPLPAVSDLFMAHLHKTPAIARHISSHADKWGNLWVDLFENIVKFMHGAFIPMEWAHAHIGTGQRDDGQEDGGDDDDEKEEEGKKKGKKENGSFSVVDALAVRRCMWSFAIQKRVEEIERLTRIETKRPLFQLKRWAFFPQPDFVPGHILCGNGLLDRIAKDWNAQFPLPSTRKPKPPPKRKRKRKPPAKQVRKRKRQAASDDEEEDEEGDVDEEEGEDDYVDEEQDEQTAAASELVSEFASGPAAAAPSPAFPDPRRVSSWREMSTKPASFWLSHDRKRMVNTFTTNGVDVSWIEQRVHVAERPQQKKKKAVHRRGAKRAPLTKEQRQAYAQEKQREKESRMNYVEDMSFEQLEEMNVQMVAAIDENRKNPFIVVARLLRHMNDRYDDPEMQEIHRKRDIIIRFSKRELKHKYGLKRQARVRENLAKAEFPSLPAAHAFLSPPSIKGTSTQLLQNYWTFMNRMTTDGRFTHLDRCLEFYGMILFRRLRMESYSNRQRWWSYVRNRIYTTINSAYLEHEGLPSDSNRPFTLPQPQGFQPPADYDPYVSPRILFAVGDGSFRHNSRGHLAMPGGEKLRKELTRLGELVGSVCEHNSSKCCCECGQVTQQASLVRRPDVARSSKHNKQLASQLAEVARRRDHPTPEETEARRRRTEYNALQLLKSAPYPPLPADAAASDADSDSDSESDSPVVAIPSPSSDSTSSAPVAEAPPTKARLTRWGLRVCSTPQCRNRIACRDVNADKNFVHRIGWTLTRKRPGPPFLLPPVQQAAEVAYWLAAVVQQSVTTKLTGQNKALTTLPSSESMLINVSGVNLSAVYSASTHLMSFLRESNTYSSRFNSFRTSDTENILFGPLCMNVFTHKDIGRTFFPPSPPLPLLPWRKSQIQQRKRTILPCSRLPKKKTMKLHCNRC
jgi:hypothetical protein